MVAINAFGVKVDFNSLFSHVACKIFASENCLTTFCCPVYLPNQGWTSDIGIDGPTFVPKSGYFLLIWVKVCPQKLAFSQFFSQFHELASLIKCWLFQTRNPPLSLFLAFLAVVFSQFCSNIILKVAF